MRDDQQEHDDRSAGEWAAHDDALRQQMEEASYCHAVGTVADWLAKRQKADRETISRLLMRLADLDRQATAELEH